MLRPMHASLLLTLAAAGLAQDKPAQDTRGSQPIYRVTIVSRTTKAINYDRHIPTQIDFKGTPVLSSATGRATVESKRGSTAIDAHFQHVDPPTRFGPQFLTYVVWAISPDGRVQNLGELVVNGSNKGRLTASTNMQTFAMIVTAEPDFSVAKPSDVVVMENAVRSDTVGKVQEVNASYELMPRHPYTYDRTAPVATSGKNVSMDEYEALVAIYQAQNAVQLAESEGAQRYAPDRLARAQQLLAQAQGYPKSLKKDILSIAREATQVAEDARAITAKRVDQERLTGEQVDRERKDEQARANANREAERAREEAERAARETARAAELAARTQPVVAPPTTMAQRPVGSGNDAAAQERRARLTSTLNRTLTTIDTPRGVVVTIPETLVGTATLRSKLSEIAYVIRSFPRLQIEVEGHTDRGDVDANTIAQGYADSVRDALVGAGVAAGAVGARGYGNSRLLASNATESGRIQNRRVELVITGDALGRTPVWDRTYSLSPSR
jgi:outer membrane protein OmpA-like peptidoglycan-associated protein